MKNLNFLFLITLLFIAHITSNKMKSKSNLKFQSNTRSEMDTKNSAMVNSSKKETFPKKEKNTEQHIKDNIIPDANDAKEHSSKRDYKFSEIIPILFMSALP